MVQTIDKSGTFMKYTTNHIRIYKVFQREVGLGFKNKI
jgi:hypothetical protein